MTSRQSQHLASFIAISSKPMKKIFVFLIVAIAGCQQKQKPAEVVSKDSIVAEKKQGSYFISKQEKTTRFKDYSIKLVNYYEMADSTVEKSFQYFKYARLLFYNGNNKLIDSLQPENIGSNIDYVETVDLTDSLHFKTPFFAIHWTGDSDMPMTTLFSFDSNHLKEVSTIYDLTTIQRQDAFTLAGTSSHSDEIVYSRQPDYPFTISLRTFQMKEIVPEVQDLDFISETLEPITGKYGNITYTIPAGKKVIVDTLFRKTRQLILIVSDSIRVMVDAKEAANKLQHETAG